MLERALSQMERASSDIEAAHKSGKELIKILCAPGTKRGDIIKIIPAGMDEDCPEEDKMPGKVIAVHGMTGIDPETMQMHRMCEAIVALLKPGDITTEEDFASLYSEDPSEEQDAAVKALFDATPEELGEAAVAQAQEEAPDPNVCSCGANREMCARNQNVFGGHLNE
jgi:hypothetical protein